jgi:hypothetical protein
VGYFKKKVRRGSSAEEKRRHEKAGIPLELGEWIAADERPPRNDQTKYIRLMTDENDPDSQQLSGVFQVAYQLVRSSDLQAEEHKQLSEALDWFDANLPVPKKVPRRSIFWFKSDAGESINRIWQIVNVLRAHGHDVRMMRTDKPGKVVYEDDLQIAAVAKWRLRS